MKKLKQITAIITLFTICLSPLHLEGFTQYVKNMFPMGHEWLTRLAAFEVMEANGLIIDPQKVHYTKPDPRKLSDFDKSRSVNLGLTGSQKSYVNRLINSSLKPKDSRLFFSEYYFIYSAIMGVRWVDLAGVNVTKAKFGEINVFDVVAQEPSDLQYDHFMRAHDDYGNEGGVAAAKNSQERFVDYFVDAATAKSRRIVIWDGGVYSERKRVDLNYFLFGRAAHLFQDAFSPEHVVRMESDGFRAVQQVKSYLCNSGSEQHTHSLSKIPMYTSGDVIWKNGTQSESGKSGYQPGNMKRIALVATEATKDLWAAFFRVMAVPQGERELAARKEAAQLVANWLQVSNMAGDWYDTFSRRDKTYVNNDVGPGIDVAQCMREVVHVKQSREQRLNMIQERRKVGVYNINSRSGYSSEYDPYIRIPFNWEWKNEAKWETPLIGYEIPKRGNHAEPRIVRIQSYKNDLWLYPKKGSVVSDQRVYTGSKENALEFVISGSDKHCYLRLRYHPILFLSYVNATGRSKLYNAAKHANFTFESVDARKVGGRSNVYQIKYQTNDYLWVDNKKEVWLTKSGEKKGSRNYWIVEEVN